MQHTASFEYNGATVTVQRPSGFSRVRVWQLRQALDDTGDIPKDIADTLCYYLANTVKVDGSLGFPVPLETPTLETLLAFIRGLGEAEESLLQLWDSTLYGLKYATNDPDLLPPEALDEKKDNPKKSKSNA